MNAIVQHLDHATISTMIEILCEIKIYFHFDVTYALLFPTAATLTILSEFLFYMDILLIHF